jgi:thiol-disulfide isomerase/thioredoxin
MKRTLTLMASLCTALGLMLATHQPAFGNIAVGDKVKIEFTALDGTKVTNETLKDKVVVLDFWATWCPPCMAKMPKMKELNKKYAEQGVQIVGMSLDRPNDTDKVKQTVKELELNWIHGHDADRTFSQPWGIRGIPHIVILSPDSEVLWRGHPNQMDKPLADAVEKYLGDRTEVTSTSHADGTRFTSATADDDGKKKRRGGKGCGSCGDDVEGYSFVSADDDGKKKRGGKGCGGCGDDVEIFVAADAKKDHEAKDKHGDKADEKGQVAKSRKAIAKANKALKSKQYPGFLKNIQDVTTECIKDDKVFEDMVGLFNSLSTIADEEEQQKFVATMQQHPDEAAHFIAINRAMAERAQQEQQQQAQQQGGVQVGDKPEFKFTSIDGKEVSNQTLAGKIVVLDFWATWCPPCMAKMPKMKELNKQYKDKGVQIVGMSLDRPNDTEKVKNTVEELELNWIHGHDADRTFTQPWGVRGIPRIFILSPEGEVLWTGHPNNMEGPLKEALESHPPRAEGTN